MIALRRVENKLNWKALALFAILAGFYASQAHHGFEEALGIAHHASHEDNCQLCDIYLSAHDIPAAFDLDLFISSERCEYNAQLEEFFIDSYSSAKKSRAPPVIA